MRKAGFNKCRPCQVPAAYMKQSYQCSVCDILWNSAKKIKGCSVSNGRPYPCFSMLVLLDKNRFDSTFNLFPLNSFCLICCWQNKYDICHIYNVNRTQYMKNQKIMLLFAVHPMLLSHPFDHLNVTILLFPASSLCSMLLL